MHLNADELIDLAEGTRQAQELPHVAHCLHCRREVEALREALGAAASVEVPEPSPLFWDHLSARVREAVAAEQAARRSWWSPASLGWRVLVPGAAAAAAIILAVLVWTPSAAPGPGPAPLAAGSAPFEIVDSLVAADDVSYVLIQDLANGLDWDAALEAGLTTRPQAFGHLAGALDASERLELQRLLEAELAGDGA